MNVKNVADIIEGELTSAFNQVNRNVKNIHAGDLLSHVMANTSEGDAWITVHTHLNTIAVAVLNELSCIIIPYGIAPEEPTIKKADCENIPIISTKLNVYDICTRIYEYLQKAKE